MAKASIASLVDSVLWLCSIPSPTGQEAALCDALMERLGGLGNTASLRRFGNSLVLALGDPDPSRTHIVLAGHLDTVQTVHDGPPRVEGDRLYGCGASDMKAGVALMLDVAESFQPTRDKVRVVLVFYAAEEGPYCSNELEVVLRDSDELRRVDLAVCLEPSDNALQLGCAGTLHATVTFRGRSAHSARPWQGDNAIHKLGPLLCELAERKPVFHECDGLRFASVVSATMAQGGVGRNVVPPQASLNLNYRFPPGMKDDEARRVLEDLVAGRADIEVTDLAPSAMPHRSHPLVQALVNAGVRSVEAKQAWTDVARFSVHGIPAVNFGPGVQAQAHQRNEWTSIQQVQDGQRILRAWLDGLAR